MKTIKITNDTECYAIRGKVCIDTIDPETGLTHVYGKTFDEVQFEEPQAERMTLGEFCRSKAATQDTPIQWTETTEERYHDMLNILPPAAMCNGAFLVGEPYDHHTITGEPRFAGYRKVGDKFLESSRPLTVRELGAVLGRKVQNWYIS